MMTRVRRAVFRLGQRPASDTVRFRDSLQSEFEWQSWDNRRYSLRTFAALMGKDHSTLSQILRDTCPVPLARPRAWELRLGLDPKEAADYVAAECVPRVAGRRLFFQPGQVGGAVQAGFVA